MIKAWWDYGLEHIMAGWQHNLPAFNAGATNSCEKKSIQNKSVMYTEYKQPSFGYDIQTKWDSNNTCKSHNMKIIFSEKSISQNSCLYLYIPIWGFSNWVSWELEWVLKGAKGSEETLSSFPAVMLIFPFLQNWVYITNVCKQSVQEVQASHVF